MAARTVKRPFFPENRTGIGLDAVAILATLFIFPYLISRVGNLFDLSFKDDPQAFKTLAALMAMILTGRLIGLISKGSRWTSRNKKRDLDTHQYLSPRTVFLIEDGRYKGTWAFIFGVFLASIGRNL